MNNVAAIVILLLLCAVRPVLALDVTVEQCVELALQNNGSLKAAEMENVAAAEQVGISRTGFLPSLKLTGSSFLFDKAPRMTVDAGAFGAGIPAHNVELPLQDNSFYYLTLSLEQPLFTGGRLTHTLLRSKALSEEATHRAAARRREVALDVRQTFYLAENARLYARVVEKALEAKRERLRILRELRSEGYATQEEILQQETDLQFAELELLLGRNRESLALSRLKNLIHHTGSDALRLKGAPAYRTLVVPLDQLRDATLANREDLKAAQARTRASEEEIAIEKSAFYPRASLTGNFIQQKETSITRPQQWVLVANLEWSLFEWGKTVSEVNRKTAQRQKMRYEAEELQKDALLAVEQVWRAIGEREKGVQAHGKKIQAASYRLRQQVEKYAAGEARLAEVLETEAEFIKAFSDYLTAVNNLNNQFARLEEATCADIGPWSRREEIVSPDFAPHTSRLREGLARRKAPHGETKEVTPDAGALERLLRELIGAE